MEFYKKTQDEGSKQLKEEGEEALGLGIGIIKFEDDAELSWAETSPDLDANYHLLYIILIKFESKNCSSTSYVTTG
ncbi:unnamed protein product [Cuscuta campestris]|uniref:Uncharacterized protein n=1 Tax=Cuscuta campestris TaxID=132261 RepID=A0A484K501_9ASTE|nr:unnamed protein product [Cuscuta campestris]